MVQLAIVKLPITSVHDALRISKESKKQAVDKKDSPSTTTRANIVPMPYPVGRSTLQVTGVHVTLHKTNKSGDENSSLPDNELVVLIRAHVKGELDTTARVFTVAAVTLGGLREVADSSAKRRAVNDIPQKIPAIGNKGAKTEVSDEVLGPCSAFAKLDLRLQMEKISFSVDVFSPASRRTTPVSHSDGKDLSDNALTVTVLGVVSPFVI
ncbi:hypothetical protein LSM04_008453 [Trypanosoma melophagium]|uniref:uncharacterized protein n=1 Tax=Trypanosoma melophagium TaxID=715481 RepID=UPI00351A66F1|nr:hypothetical protein LSM04_008453 [Trypanosoma melophagium]